MYIRYSLIFILLLMAACSAAPPARHTVSHDPTLSRQGGVLLLADVCIQKDGIGDSDDYFVIAESKYAAETVLSALHSYVEDSNIPVRAEIPVVCAARHGKQNTIRAGDNFNATARDAPQPIYVEASIAKDTDYTNAIAAISTYAFERAALKGQAQTNKISTIEFLDAADIIQNRTQASSILFLGVLGTSKTSAKTAVTGVGNFIARFATAVVTAGLGTDYYLMFSPGQQFSGRFMEGALIDLQSGELTWSNALKVGGNPIKPETWSNHDPLDLLFHDLLFQQTPMQ
jgi:hypothetical protein